MADPDRPIQAPKEWKALNRAIGSHLPHRLRQTRSILRKMHKLGGKRG